MRIFPGSTRIGVDLFNPLASIAVFQNNPGAMTRRLEPRAVSSEEDRGEDFSNTYARVIAERCGAVGLRPPGSVPGFDDAAPVAGTGGPNPYLSALTGICNTNDRGYFDCPD